MVFTTKQEEIDFFKEVLKEAEPYSEEEFIKMSTFDGKSHIGDARYAATSALRVLLKLGFTEDEVNPWKNK